MEPEKIGKPSSNIVKEYVQVDINEALAKANENQKLVEVLPGVNIVSLTDKKENFSKMSLCNSTVTPCRLQVIKGFEFCHKHILEDKTSPYQYCCFRSKGDGKKCINPAPKLGDQKSFCLYHEKQRSKTKKKKVKDNLIGGKMNPNVKQQPQQSRSRISSSEDEDYSFFTDSVQMDKTICTWLGNQASDADSTDSEDENPLNHAGVWTLEECVRLCKEKVERLRFLYMQQYKRLSYCLREERRKMLNEFDMDPYTLSKVDVTGLTDDPHHDFVEDRLLSNYQKLSGVERLAEKQMKEKKNHTHHGKRSELPRCHYNTDGARCTSRVLPFSKYCYNHICLDQDQNLFEECLHKEKNEEKCKVPAELFGENCCLHVTLEVSKSQRLLNGINIAKKAKETKKRKLEQAKAEKKEEVKKDVVYHNTRRASKNREENLKSPTISTSPSPTSSHTQDFLSYLMPETSIVKSEREEIISKLTPAIISCNGGMPVVSCGTSSNLCQSNITINTSEIASKIQIIESSENILDSKDISVIDSNNEKASVLSMEVDVPAHMVTEKSPLKTDK